MDDRRKRYISGRKRYSGWVWNHILALPLLLGFLLLELSQALPPAYADGMPGGDVQDPVVRAVDIARPAVVRIVTEIGGRLTVHFSATQQVTFPLNGGSYGLAALGTGTFISAHGDILTADHVVRPPKDDQLNAVLIKAAAPDVAAYYDSVIRPGSSLSADQMEQALLSGQFPSDPTYSQPASLVYLSTDYSGPLSAASLRDVPAQYVATVDRIEQESPPNQKDVAIIHVAMDDMPSVQLGDSSNVQVQDNLTIIGFPGNADVSMRPTDFLTSSVNRIFVSSIKTTDSGAQVIQVGGNVEQGDSGGPALDSQGQVVGIVSFGTPGGTSFLQASNSARALVSALHLDTTPGPFQRAWEQAFNDYASTAAGHWHRAAQEFASLAARYPAFKAVTPYLNYARQQAAHESTVAPSKKPAQGSGTQALLPWVATGAGAMAVLILALGGLTLVLVRRRRGQRGGQRAAAVPRDIRPVPGPQFGDRSSQAPVGFREEKPLPPAMPPGYGGGPRPAPPNAPPAVPPPQSGRPPSVFSPAAPAPVPTPASPSGPPAPRPGVPAGGAIPVPQPGAALDDTLVPFGGPGRRSATGNAAPFAPGTGPTHQGGGSAVSPISGLLRPWPCGHMNRPNARFCSTCGEPAPPPPTIRRIEQ
jgi:serine protease Do